MSNTNLILSPVQDLSLKVFKSLKNDFETLDVLIHILETGQRSNFRFCAIIGLSHKIQKLDKENRKHLSQLLKDLKNDNEIIISEDETDLEDESNWEDKLPFQCLKYCKSYIE